MSHRPVAPSQLAARRFTYLRTGDLRATADRVIVQPARRRTQTSTGLVLPDTAEYETKEFIGRVLSVGPGQRNVSVGDIVLYRQFAGTEMQVGPRQIVVLANEDLQAVIEP